MENGYVVSTDKTKLDVATIHDYLSNRSYWGQGRTIDMVRRSIDHSMCFGMYDQNNQIVGFARVITDYTVFAYLADVFILEGHRNRGLGKMLVNQVINHDAFKDIRFWRLDTKDAHGLYRKVGFREPSFPERMMEKRRA